jgi:hypothetical protein
MHGGGKSDRPVDTEEAAEQRQVRFLPAEAAEGRGLTEGEFVPAKQVPDTEPGKDLK